MYCRGTCILHKNKCFVFTLEVKSNISRQTLYVMFNIVFSFSCLYFWCSLILCRYYLNGKAPRSKQKLVLEMGQLRGNSMQSDEANRSAWTAEEKDMFVKGMVSLEWGVVHVVFLNEYRTFVLMKFVSIVNICKIDFDIIIMTIYLLHSLKHRSKLTNQRDVLL